MGLLLTIPIDSVHPHISVTSQTVKLIDILRDQHMISRLEDEHHASPPGVLDKFYFHKAE